MRSDMGAASFWTRVSLKWGLRHTGELIAGPIRPSQEVCVWLSLFCKRQGSCYFLDFSISTHHKIVLPCFI